MHPYGISGDTVLDELRELTLVSILVLFKKVFHIVGNVLAEDMGAVDISVELASLLIVAGEALFAVGDIETAIGGSLHGSKDLGAGGSSGKANIEARTEGSGAVRVVLHHEVGTIDFHVSLVRRVEVELLQHL